VRLVKKMIRVCLIGPGDIKFHFQELLGINKNSFNKIIKDIANCLFDSGVEIALLPDKGICIEIAREFKKLGGRVIGLAPVSDKHPGIRFLERYIKEKINNKDLFDEIIDTGDWPRHDLHITLFGDVVLYLGNSPGSERELSSGVYMYKIIKGIKSEVNQPIETIHKQACAGKKIPFTILIFRNFLKSKKLYIEDENYMKKFNVNYEYIDSPDEIKRELKKLNQTT
jgi:hypothetical protein